MSKLLLKKPFEIHHFHLGDIAKVTNNENDLYAFQTYIGNHESIKVESGDSAWVIRTDHAEIIRGPNIIDSELCTTIIRGYCAPEQSSTYQSIANLPYINGCASHQIFPPIRPGDPTLQLLYMPLYTEEQAHHIHPTVRIVTVLEGRGTVVAGMGENIKETPLIPGDVLVLEKMTPHHFYTKDSHLIVSPLHLYSSIPGKDYDHPMFNGTFKIN